MKKRTLLFAALVLLCLELLIGGASATTGNVEVLVFGQQVEFDVQPTVENNRILVPVRQIAEALGANLDYDTVMKTVTVEKGSYTITLVVDSTSAVKTVGQTTTSLTLDVPARIINNRTMVPIRFIAESFDIDVTWNAATNTVNVGMYLATDPIREGWVILKGHPYENVLEIGISETTDGKYTSTHYAYRDLTHNMNQTVSWFDGEATQTTTRQIAYGVIAENDSSFSTSLMRSYFGTVYDDWLRFNDYCVDSAQFYQRYQNSIDPTRYGTTPAPQETFVEIGSDGGIDSAYNSAFAQIGDNLQRINNMNGDPLSTEEESMAVEEGTPRDESFRLNVYYDSYTLFLYKDAMIGFTTDTKQFGCNRIFVGDSVQKIYSTLKVNPDNVSAHKNYFGTTVITLYLKNDIGSHMVRIREEEALDMEGYYTLEYRLDENKIITNVTLEKHNFS